MDDKYYQLINWRSHVSREISQQNKNAPLSIQRRHPRSILLSSLPSCLIDQQEHQERACYRTSSYEATHG